MNIKPAAPIPAAHYCSRSPRFAILAATFLCHLSGMPDHGTQSRLAPRLVDALYVEAMVLADEVRSYFDGAGSDARDALPPLVRVHFSCEALRVTSRLMHVVAWLLTRRALEAGEIAPAQGRDPGRRLGHAADSDPAAFTALPDTARALIEASRELYQRVQRLDQDMDSIEAPPSPVSGLLRRLERAF